MITRVELIARPEIIEINAFRQQATTYLKCECN